MATSHRTALAQSGEEIAARYLAQLGYRILKRNYRTRFGEIDIVAREGDTLCFIEVKARRSFLISGRVSIDRRKQRKLSLLAAYFIKERGLFNKRARFDVVCVSDNGRAQRIELIRSAFEYID